MLHFIFSVLAAGPCYHTYVTLHLLSSDCRSLLSYICYTSSSQFWLQVPLIIHMLHFIFSVLAAGPSYHTYVTLHLLSSGCRSLLSYICYTSSSQFWLQVPLIIHMLHFIFSVLAAGPSYHTYVTLHLLSSGCRSLLSYICYTSSSQFWLQVPVIIHMLHFIFSVLAAGPSYHTYVTLHLLSSGCRSLLSYICYTSSSQFWLQVPVIIHMLHFIFSVLAAGPSYHTYVTLHLLSSGCRSLLSYICYTSSSQFWLQVPLIIHMLHFIFSVLAAGPSYHTYVTLHLLSSDCRSQLSYICYTSSSQFWLQVPLIIHMLHFIFSVLAAGPSYHTYVTLHLLSSGCRSLLSYICYTSSSQFWLQVPLIIHMLHFIFSVLAAGPSYHTYVTLHLLSSGCRSLLSYICYTSSSQF
ncbi:hypothetical protein RRG08_053554 [Elysia crispata]|uniref:Uncharacterized protein n=1 Tax=Elysia crispata TaxID=231223 RepID=A0AAE0Y1A9_9GAST|nr:hypothetical protein RRG08_053554 [Elysia crispata]